MKIIKGKNTKYYYNLQTLFRKNMGYIKATRNRDTLEIVGFWVDIKYRGTIKRFGKQLLDHLIQEGKDTGIHYIFVTPKPEELNDNIALMDLPELYRKYLNLGFDYVNGDALKPYGNVMKMVL